MKVKYVKKISVLCKARPIRDLLDSFPGNAISVTLLARSFTSGDRMKRPYQDHFRLSYLVKNSTISKEA